MPVWQNLAAHQGHINMTQFDAYKLVTAANDKKVKGRSGGNFNKRCAK